MKDKVCFNTAAMSLEISAAHNKRTALKNSKESMRFGTLSLCIIFDWVNMRKNLEIIIFPSSGAVSGPGVSEDNSTPCVPYN